MADVLNRVTFEFRKSEHTPDFDSADWVHNPDLSPVNGVPEHYWKLTGDVLSEMSQGEKDTVDAAEAAAAQAAQEALVKSALTGDPLDGLVVDVAISGLDMTVNIETLVVDDVTSITADPSDTTTAMVCYIFNEDTDALSLQVYVKTVGLYADMLLEERLVRCMGEWEVVANGTVLTPVV